MPNGAAVWDGAPSFGISGDFVRPATKNATVSKNSMRCTLTLESVGHQRYVVTPAGLPASLLITCTSPPMSPTCCLRRMLSHLYVLSATVLPESPHWNTHEVSERDRSFSSPRFFRLYRRRFTFVFARVGATHTTHVQRNSSAQQGTSIPRPGANPRPRGRTYICIPCSFIRPPPFPP